MDDERVVTFRRVPNGYIVLEDTWPEELDLTLEVIQQAGDVIKVNGTMLTLTALNGTAMYETISMPEPGVVRTRRRSCTGPRRTT